LDLTSATGLTPGSRVSPPNSHRTFHTPDVFTSAAVPEVTPTVSTGPELSTLSPTALWDTAGLNSNVNALHDIKHKICLVSTAPFALLQKQGMPCYVLQIRPECPDAGSDPVSSSLHSASNILSTTNLTKEESSLFNKIIPPEYHDFDDVFSKAGALLLLPHQPYDMKIKLESNTLPPVGPVYLMSELELHTLCEYLDKMLGKGFI